MKIESRGKYAGVKVHLDAEECEALIHIGPVTHPQQGQTFAAKLGKLISDKLTENPQLLTDRTDAEVAAILAKESEKAAIQLAQLKRGADWKKIDPQQLRKALLKHVEVK